MKRSRTRVQKACRANFVTFNKAELPRPWVRCVWEAAAKYTKKPDVSDKRPLKTIEKHVFFAHCPTRGRINISAFKKILRKVPRFLYFFCGFQVWPGRRFEETSKNIVFSCIFSLSPSFSFLK